MSGFEDYLSIVVQDIFQTVSLEVFVNPGTHPSLKDCPVGPVIASFDGVKVYLSWDVPVGWVRLGSKVHDQWLMAKGGEADENTPKGDQVPVVRGKTSGSGERVPPTPQNERGGGDR